MSTTVIDLLISLNALANRCGQCLLAPIAFLPGWLSATLVAAVTGVCMLVIFRYTSHQSAIKRARSQIKANLLALSLFQDNVVVSLRCQGRVFAGACRLLSLSIVPMLVMTLPMCLLLAQLALWYEARPLRVGEETVLTVQLADDAAMPEIRMNAIDGVEATIGPVRVPSKRMICWNLRAEKEGRHHLSFDVASQTIEKEFAVGNGFMQVSERRPPRVWSEVIMHPRETPFPRESIVQSVSIDYPRREGWASGSGWWLAYWFLISMLAAFFMRPWLKVQI